MCSPPWLTQRKSLHQPLLLQQQKLSRLEWKYRHLGWVVPRGLVMTHGPNLLNLLPNLLCQKQYFAPQFSIFCLVFPFSVDVCFRFARDKNLMSFMERLTITVADDGGSVSNFCARFQPWNLVSVGETESLGTYLGSLRFSETPTKTRQNSIFFLKHVTCRQLSIRYFAQSYD